MKQKNLILIAVAVVCGLVAAVLTSRMSAGTSKPKAEDFVEVPVAARDIPIGTRIPAKDLEQFFTPKKFPKDALPQSYVAEIKDVGDKRLMRPIRMGEVINPADFSTSGFIQLPDGHVMMTTPINMERGGAGFALPGSRVMVIATVKSLKKNSDIVFPLFLDALVLAVDTNQAPPAAKTDAGANGSAQPTGATAAAFQQMSMISFAVTPEDSILLSMAADKAQLRLALPEQDETKKEVVIGAYRTLVPTKEEIRKIFADDWAKDEPKKEVETPKVETVKVKVPTEFLEVGTELTDEVLEKKFKEIEFPKEFLNAEAATTDKELQDKFVTSELAPNLLAPKSHLSKTKPKKPDANPVVGSGVFAAAKVEPTDVDGVTSPKADAEASLPVPVKPEYTYVTITTSKGKVIQKFEKTAKGLKYVGDVTQGLSDDE